MTTEGYPLADDRLLWDLHLSGFKVYALTAADELGVFDSLVATPANAQELSARLGISERAARALLPMLASSGLLEQRLGRYHATQVVRDFLYSKSPFYWGPVLAVLRRMPLSHEHMVAQLKAPEEASQWDLTDDGKPSNAWSAGEIPPEAAAMIASYMNANSLQAAAVAARSADLYGVRRLLDVGAGSGCFSIALARQHPALHCTLMDLKGMCDVAQGYVQAAGLQSRIGLAPIDMFREAWPQGHDALWLSNIFHDWDPPTCEMLARRAFSVLPSGGRIYLHEMLLDDSRDGPATPVAFSMYMLLGTKGQQFSASELRLLLEAVGFTQVSVHPAHAHYAVVMAQKP